MRFRANGRTADATGQFEEALRLKPDFAEAENNLGNIRWEEDRRPEAIARCQRALEFRPLYPEADNNLGVAATGPRASGRTRRSPISSGPSPSIRAISTPGSTSASPWPTRAGRRKRSPPIARCWRRSRTSPRRGVNLAITLARSGQLDAALEQFREVVRERPGFRADARYNLANALGYLAGHLAEAVADYEAALRLRPDYEAARQHLERVREMLAAP